MISPLGIRPTALLLRPVGSARSREPGPVDQLELSQNPAPSRSWWARVRDWATGSARETALEQAGLPGATAQVAELPPQPEPVTELGPDNDAGRVARAMLDRCQQSSSRQALERVASEAPAEPRAQTVLDLLASLPASDAARALPVAFRELEPVCPQHVALAQKVTQASQEPAAFAPLGLAILSRGVLGASLEEAALEGLEAVPSSYSGNAARMALATAGALPSQALAARAAGACSDDTIKTLLVKAGLKAHLAGKAPGPTALDLMAAVPSNYRGNLRLATEAIMTPLSGDGEVGAAVRTAARVGEACSDENLRPGIYQAVLQSRLQGETNPGRWVLAGLGSIPSNFPGNRSAATRAGLEALKKDSALGGYAQLGSQMCQALSDQALSQGIGQSVIESGLAGKTLAETARAAMETIPSAYPGNRNQVGTTVLAALADSADVSLAREMVAASEDTTCRNAMILTALEIVTGEQKDALVVTGQKLLSSIPSEYPGNRAKVGAVLLKRLRSHYDEPEAAAKIDAALQRLGNGSSVALDELLDELVKHRSTAQQVADLAAAVSGKKESSGIEERGQVVVIGGVRVKVKS